MPPRVIESPRGGHMHGGAELRRVAEFLQDLEKNLASPLTDTDPNSFQSLPARRNPQIQQSTGDSQCPPARNPSTRQLRRSPPPRLRTATPAPEQRARRRV